MTVALYMDQHVPDPITKGLRRRGVDIITTFEERRHELADADLLDRASELERVLFTQDDDLLAEAAYRQRNGIFFHGVIYGHQQRVSIGDCVEDLELIAKTCEAADVINDVVYLPL
jgi:hypothetical protein